MNAAANDRSAHRRGGDGGPLGTQAGPPRPGPPAVSAQRPSAGNAAAAAPCCAQNAIVEYWVPRRPRAATEFTLLSTPKRCSDGPLKAKDPRTEKDRCHSTEA